MDLLPLTNEKDFKAIELKYLGNSYQEIAQAVGVEHSTVKSWFMRSGRLSRAYLEYSMEESKNRKDNARQLFAISMDKAVKTLSGLLDSQDERVRFAAAKEIIERQHLEDEPTSSNDLQEIKITDLMEAAKRIRIQEEQEKSRLLVESTKV